MSSSTASSTRSALALSTQPAPGPLLGGNLLYGLCKPDGGTRPIGVGGALRRLVGRIAMADLGEDMARVFTETKPSAEQLIRHGFAGDHPCLTPVQVGVAIKGGAEIAIALARLVLHKHRSWAMIADDKKNGFNAVSRESIFKGLRQWFPQLIPLARFFYSRQGELYTCDAKGRRAVVDEVGESYFSAEGCTQGDSGQPRAVPLRDWLSLRSRAVTQARLPHWSSIRLINQSYMSDVLIRFLSA